MIEKITNNIKISDDIEELFLELFDMKMSLKYFFKKFSNQLRISNIIRKLIVIIFKSLEEPEWVKVH